MSKDPNINLPLSQIVKLILRDDFERDIPTPLAEIIEILAKDTLICHVQWNDKYNPDLTGPKLWLYQAWATHSDRWERAKKKSEEERVKRFIFEANVRIVTKACKAYLNLDDNWGTSTAFALLKQNRMIAIEAICGKNKLITKEEEL